MNKQISFYELDILSKIGIAGGWLALILFILYSLSYIILSLLR